MENNLTQPRDHGGNLDAAIARFGGARADWCDLSTGINPVPYPVPNIPARAWMDLPQKCDFQRLYDAASAAFGWPHDLIPFAGAQGAIQAMPHLLGQLGLGRQPQDFRILSPTYNEHAGAMANVGAPMREVTSVAELYGARLATVVSPNNPDGRVLSMDELRELAQTCAYVVLDESFADVDPNGGLTAKIAQTDIENVIILRSFGKFYGLAGLRLGFALARGEIAAHLRNFAGPWQISGPAIEIASKAYDDRDWQQKTIARLYDDANRLDRMALSAGWSFVGGSALFRTYHVDNAQTIQEKLAQSHIWTRVFPYSNHWIRLGLAGSAEKWQQLALAFSTLG